MDEDGWTPAVPADQLAEGKPIRVELDGEAVLLVRSGDRLFAMENRCSHQGAPLYRGPVRFGSLNHVTCPAHGSMFNLEDGAVLRGAASNALATYDARVTEGMVEIRKEG
ncbi:MAG: Rieske (2Fe-2S) protein [Actinomycetota bacterium]